MIDDHSVDEDQMTISVHGGEWGLSWHDTQSGVFLRAMTNPTTDDDYVVASRKYTTSVSPFDHQKLSYGKLNICLKLDTFDSSTFFQNV